MIPFGEKPASIPGERTGYAPADGRRAELPGFQLNVMPGQKERSETHDAARSGRVLLIDDDPSFVDLLTFKLEALGHTVASALSWSDAEPLVSRQVFDLCLLDYELGEHDGLELIAPIRTIAPQLPVVLLTAHSDPKLVVDAIQRGAMDFLTKPVDDARLTAALATAIRERDLIQEVARLRARGDGSEMIGQSAGMLAVRQAIDAVAPTDATVLVTGESGTGKELVAQAVHAGSRRSQRPLVVLNMAALPRELAEATLFGHERGAFTGAERAREGAFAEADGGTLFLDEIGEMPLDLQAKILRFLQDGTYRTVGGSEERRADVRIVSATNRDLLARAQAGEFREDLYYRLNVVPIELPPLRDRDDDIDLLATHALKIMAKRHGKQFKRIHRSALDLLAAHDWPGNVRELMHVVERAVVLHDAEVLTGEMLPASRPASRPASNPATSPAAEAPPAAPQQAAPAVASADPAPPEILPMAEVERRAILEALRVAEGAVPAAAQMLEISAATIYRKLKACGIDPKALRK